jgi:hypothetical protein
MTAERRTEANAADAGVLLEFADKVRAGGDPSRLQDAAMRELVSGGAPRRPCYARNC